MATISDVFVSLMGLGDMRSLSVLEFAAGGAMPVITRQREYELMQQQGFVAALTPPGDVAGTVEKILRLLQEPEHRLLHQNVGYLTEHEDRERNRTRLGEWVGALLQPTVTAR